MASEKWKEVIDKAKELAKVASAATKQELSRARDEIEVALERTTSELERTRLMLEKRMVDSALADKEISVLGKEVITSNGGCLGTVRDVRIDVGSRKAWIVVSKTFGKPKDIPVDNIKSIKDKITVSSNGGTSLKTDKESSAI